MSHKLHTVNSSVDFTESESWFTPDSGKLFLAKLLFFATAMSTVGWNKFQNNFYMDNGLTPAQIGTLKSIGLLLKFFGDPIISFIADSTDSKVVFLITMVMQILSMELLRFVHPLTYGFILTVKILRTTTAPAGTLTTAASFKLTEGTNQGYGQQRTFGSLAWGCGAVICGVLIDKYGMNFLFYYTYFFQILSLLIVIFALPRKFTNNATRDDSTSKQIATATSTPVSGLFAQFVRHAKIKEFVYFVNHEKIRIVLLNAFIFGIVMTVADTFIYISLEKDYHASRTLNGFATTVSTLSCIPLFWYSDYFIRRFGHHKIIYYSQLICCIRFLINMMIPLHLQIGEYLLLLSQLLHGFNFAWFFASCVDIFYRIAPKEVCVSCLSIFNITYFTLGGAAGNLIWGYIYDYMGDIKIVYILAAILSLCNGLYIRKYDHFFQELNEVTESPTSA